MPGLRASLAVWLARDERQLELPYGAREAEGRAVRRWDALRALLARTDALDPRIAVRRAAARAAEQEAREAIAVVRRMRTWS